VMVPSELFVFGLLRHSSPMITAWLHPVEALLLGLLRLAAAIPFVLLPGGGNGLQTIERGTVALALFGPAGYGRRTGLLARPGVALGG
jgi:hypothetical protein